MVEFSWVGLYIRDQSEECLNKFQAGNYGMNVNSFGSREEVIAVDCQDNRHQQIQCYASVTHSQLNAR